MATNKSAESDTSLPFAALQLLAPPVRLVSAALWKVMKQRDVMQYGTVEEFVTSVCEIVPGLLTCRHQGKLALGLRGRLILELCCRQPDAKVIEPHLERIRAPAPCSTSSAHTVKKDIKIMKTVDSFHALVQTLLKDPDEREQFFKEEFPVDYGPKFDQELEKLLWEFLIRVDQFLPVPNLAQTVSWISAAPPVLEECARAATQPQLLKILLRHESCLGHLESAASLPPNMGDSILASLSLPPSGRVPSNQQTGPIKSFAGQSTISSSVPETNGSQARDKAPFMTPVIGLISSEDVPVMISANKRAQRDDKSASSKDGINGNLKSKKEERNTPKCSRIKRKLPDQRESESDEEEEVLSLTRSQRKRISRSTSNQENRLRQSTSERRTNESEKDGPKTRGNGESYRAVLKASVTQLGVEMLKLPEDPYLRSLFASCLLNQPTVVIDRLEMTSASNNETGKAGKSPYDQRRNQRMTLPVKAPMHEARKLELDFPGLDDKENHPVSPSISSISQRMNTEPPRESEDYVTDSEDEATKNFKCRLFLRRYYKTKHGTYVPTLREYWKPVMTRQNYVSPGSKHR